MMNNRQMSNTTAWCFKRALLFAIALNTMFAMASEQSSTNLKMPAAVRSECTSCHIAYPPGVLVPNQWRTVLQQLSQHYGTDASVSPQELALITPYFVNNASTRTDRYTSSTTPPRVTTTPWFVRKHREIPARTWTSLAVKSASNCAACHTQAEAGSFSERELKVPGFEGRSW